ncbi:unnamed protein product [Polarella glacialis]|uniref:Uncharacterized protein n=1 Tax=Polarella glacialis TaxID=89957 RepID=A0A813DJE1_POLGL|nr:unnamed protein product [Polarella glacialis]
MYQPAPSSTFLGPGQIAPFGPQQGQDDELLASVMQRPRGYGQLEDRGDVLLAAILDDALVPRFDRAGHLADQSAALASAAVAAASAGMSFLAQPAFSHQDLRDDAALAVILQGADATPQRRRSPQRGHHSSPSLGRVLERLASGSAGGYTSRRDDASLSRALADGHHSARGRSGHLSARTSRRDDFALNRVLEQLKPDDFTSRRDDEVLARVLGGAGALTAKLPRTILPALVADVAELLHQARAPLRADVLAGGRGRGERLDQLCNPVGMTVSSDGTVLIADCGNCRVLRMVPGAIEGQVVAGRGQPVDSMTDKGFSWFEPVDVALDGAGSLLVTASGSLHLWGSQAPQGALIADGRLPSGMLLEGDGSMLFADALDHCVTRCSWQGGVAHREVVAGCPGHADGEVSADLDRLHRPFGLAIDHEGGLLIADSGNHRIIRWLPGARQGEVVAAGNGRGDRLDQLSYPRGVVAERSGSILVADTFNHRIMRWRKGATHGELVFGGHEHGCRLDQLNRPAALALAPGLPSGPDASEQSLLVADAGNHRVLRLPLRLERPGGRPPTPCRSYQPHRRVARCT